MAEKYVANQSEPINNYIQIEALMSIFNWTNFHRPQLLPIRPNLY